MYHEHFSQAFLNVHLISAKVFSGGLVRCRRSKAPADKAEGLGSDGEGGKQGFEEGAAPADEDAGDSGERKSLFELQREERDAKKETKVPPHLICTRLGLLSLRARCPHGSFALGLESCH